MQRESRKKKRQKETKVKKKQKTEEKERKQRVYDKNKNNGKSMTPPTPRMIYGIRFSPEISYLQWETKKKEKVEQNKKKGLLFFSSHSCFVCFFLSK
jgi:phage protein D